MDLWERLRLGNAEPLSVRTEAGRGQTRRALFSLQWSNESATPREQRDATLLQSRLKFIGWEVRAAANLPSLPDVLEASVDEYDLIVVLVASVYLWQQHAAHLRTLSPEFPFLVLLNGVAPSKTQCPVLSIAGPSIAPQAMGTALLLAMCDCSAATSSASPDARQLSKNAYTPLLLSHPEAPSTAVPWMERNTDAIRGEVMFTALVSVDTDEDVDGRYVGGLLKHVLGNARIRLTEKRGCLALRTNGALSLATVQQYLNDQHLAVGVTQLGESSFASEPLNDDIFTTCSTLRAANLTGVNSVSPTYRLDVTSGFAVYAIMELLAVSGVIDNEISARIESTTSPIAKAMPIAASAAGAPPTSPLGQRSAQPSTPPPQPVEATSKPSVSISPLRAAPFGKPPTIPPPTVAPSSSLSQPVNKAEGAPATTATYPTLTEHDVKSLIEQHTTRALERQRQHDDEVQAILRRELQTTREECTSLRESHAALVAELRQYQRRSDETVAHVSQGQRNLEPQLLQLQQQIDQIKESAADHRLVETALNDLRSRTATLDGIREAEERVALVGRSVQQNLDSTRHGVEGLKGHLEAMAIQHQQLVHRVETLRSGPDVQRVLEDHIRALDARIDGMEAAQHVVESEGVVFRKAFEVGLNRLFEQLRFMHDDLGSVDAFAKSQSNRIDDMQRIQNGMESNVHRIVDESLATGNERRMHAIQEQLGSVKAYCVAAIERSTELQTEKVHSIERKLANDMQRAVELLRQQQSSDVQRVQTSIEQHIKAQKQVMDELQMMSPSKLNGSPRKEEVQLLREELERTFVEHDKLRGRLKEVEMLQSDVSGFLGDEEKRLQDIQDLTRRVEDLEASVVFIESRI